jgi:hypothetical protein
MDRITFEQLCRDASLALGLDDTFDSLFGEDNAAVAHGLQA